MPGFLNRPFAPAAVEAAPTTPPIQSGPDVAWDASALAAYPDTVFCLVPISEYPTIRDLAGTVTDADFSNAADLEASGERGFLYFDQGVVYDGHSQTALQIAGEGTWSVLLRNPGNIGSFSSIFSFGGSGETEATNFLYSVQVTDAGIEFFCETSAGSDRRGFWYYPGRLDPAEVYLATVTRNSSGDLNAYLNGVRLLRASNSTGLVVGSNGTLENGGASGGTSGTLGLAEPSSIRSAVVHFRDAHSSDAEVAEIAALFEGLSAPRTTTGLSADPSDTALVVVNPDGTYSKLAPSAGTMDTTNLTHIPYTDEYATATGYAEFDATASAECVVTGDVEVEVQFVPRTFTSTPQLMIHFGPGETEGDNVQWGFFISSASRVQWRHEYGAGVNQIIDFDTPETMVAGQRYTLTARLVGTNLEVLLDGERCTYVSGAAAVGDGTATVAAVPSGGSTATAYFGSGTTNNEYVYWRVTNL